MAGFASQRPCRKTESTRGPAEKTQRLGRDGEGMGGAEEEGRVLPKKRRLGKTTTTTTTTTTSTCVRGGGGGMGRTKVRKGRRAKVRKRTTGARTYAGRIWPGGTRGAHTAQLARAYVGTDVRAHVLGALLFVCPQRSHNPPEYVKQCPQRSHYVRTYLLKQTNDVRTYVCAS